MVVHTQTGKSKGQSEEWKIQFLRDPIRKCHTKQLKTTKHILQRVHLMIDLKSSLVM